eukprot:TRINITY_DN6793_c0_g1_i4.p1 TRINITY_DN6793_c0_g1~~TRINITY_DN6793_c0_g1_i4.p1  ORF type:complete len:945 (+),score=264.45 TRINITY_DN6793_c0_g1_i4:117-2837(+)
MPCTLLLRPTLVASCIVITLVSLGGGLALYFSALEAVKDTVDQGRAVVQDSLRDSVRALNSTVSEAQRSLIKAVDDGSNADIRLFGSALRATFESVQAAAEQIKRQVQMKAARNLYPSTASTWQTTHFDLCGMILAERDRNKERVTGAGIVMIEDQESRWTGPGARYVDNYCWWDPGPGGARWWSGQTGAYWDAEEGAWASPYASIPDPETGVIDSSEITDTELIEDYEPGDPAGEWSQPETWWVEEGQIALYLSFSMAVPISPPLGSPLYGMTATVNTETDLEHWRAIVQEFNDQKGAADTGTFVIGDLEHLLVLAHTAEPMADTASDPECINGESSSIGGLGMADSSACFPVVINYTVETQFVFQEMAGGPYDVLRNGTLCTCGGEMVNCSNGRGSCAGQYNATQLFMRKHFLWNTGGFILDVLWFRDTASVQRAVEQKELEALAEASRLQQEADQRADKAQEDAEESIEESLYIMIAAVAASFLLNILVCVVWVKLLANPLDTLQTCVSLMGDVRCDEAIEEWDCRPQGCLEVQEVKTLGEGFQKSTNILKQYKSFMPQGLFVDANAPDEDSQQEEKSLSAESSPNLGESNRGGLQQSVRPSSKASKATASSRGSLDSKRSKAGLVRRSSMLGGGGEMKMKPITVVMTNMNNTHQMAQGPGDGLAAKHAAVSATFLAEAQKTRGVLLGQSGDRMVITLNAVQPCAGHRQNGTLCAVRAATMAVQDYASGVSCGVSTGKTLVGAMGAPAARTLGAVGNTINKAYACTRAAKMILASCIITQPVYADSATTVLCRAVALWSGEKISRCLLFQAIKELAAQDNDEWMYNLESQEKANPYAQLNSLAEDAAKQAAGADGAAARRLTDEALMEVVEPLVALDSGIPKEQYLSMLRGVATTEVTIDQAM